MILLNQILVGDAAQEETVTVSPYFRKTFNLVTSVETNLVLQFPVIIVNLLFASNAVRNHMRLSHVITYQNGRGDVRKKVLKGPTEYGFLTRSNPVQFVANGMKESKGIVVSPVINASMKCAGYV